MNIEIARLFFETDQPLQVSQSHLFRGYISNFFYDNDLIHNHDPQTGKNIYRYPLLQFKIVYGKAVIVALQPQAIHLLHRIFAEVTELTLHNQTYPVQKRIMEVMHEPLGLSPDLHLYEFATPCVILNQDNYQKYRASSPSQQNDLVTSLLITQLLRLSTAMAYHAEKPIVLNHQLDTAPVNLKGEEVIGFLGRFETNFLIPDFLGLGKSPSRGYGACFRVAAG